MILWGTVGVLVPSINKMLRLAFSKDSSLVGEVSGESVSYKHPLSGMISKQRSAEVVTIR